MNRNHRYLRGAGRFLALAILLFAAGSAGPAQAGPKNLGLGLVLGEPTAVSGKVWMNSENAFDFAIGGFGYYYGRHYGGLNVHGDYLWHRYGVFGGPGEDAGRKMPLYLGLGGLFASPDVAGVRGVIGVTYLFDAPFDVFFELAPTMVVVPFAGFGIDAGLGGRFYF